MIFLDSSVVIDLLEDQQEWTQWSQRAVGAFDDEPLVSNFVVVAEVAPAFRASSEVLVFLDALGVRLKPIDAEAAFRAGKAHAAYRASGGTREAILADFLIGGHAATLGATLVTRDRGRFASYFPELNLITPESHA